VPQFSTILQTPVFQYITKILFLPFFTSYCRIVDFNHIFHVEKCGFFPQSHSKGTQPSAVASGLSYPFAGVEACVPKNK